MTAAAAVVGVLVVANAISFALFGLDKRRARRGAQRIPERTLLLWAGVSGTVGAWIGMRAFRHKIRKRAFIRTVILIGAAEVVVAIGLLRLAH